MIGLSLRHFGRRLARGFRREDGTATIEFVFVVPIVLTIFMASMESGLYMIRHVMMERALDLVMREFRLGRLGTVTHDQLRNLICDTSPYITDCRSVLKVSLEPVDTTTWKMPATPPTCVDRGGTIQNEPTFKSGDENEIMIVRICAVEDPIFPTTGLGLELHADSRGGYQLIAATIFVNEPS